jgi:hypothetical protein
MYWNLCLSCLMNNFLRKLKFYLSLIKNGVCIGSLQTRTIITCHFFGVETQYQMSLKSVVLLMRCGSRHRYTGSASYHVHFVLRMDIYICSMVYL